MVEAPILFETFVRVDYARQVWEAIKAAQPKKLYFYSNKGRAEKEGEIDRNNEIRSWVNEIDWDCELHTWFREECVDVYTSLRGAISWLFENEEEGIILEDDCVPTPAFFDYCDKMLQKFKHDKRVWFVGCDNFRNANPSGYDYIFSKYTHIWGWAGWRDRWQEMPWDDLKIDDMISSGMLYGSYKTKAQVKSRIRQLRDVEEFLKKTKCWDYIMGIALEQQNSVAVYPKYHLVSNVGSNGEHSKNAGGVNFSQSVDYGKEYIIKNEPPFMTPDLEFDYFNYRADFREMTLKNWVGLYMKRYCPGFKNKIRKYFK